LDNHLLMDDLQPCVGVVCPSFNYRLSQPYRKYLFSF
jgi:hypothetical protein